MRTWRDPEVIKRLLTTPATWAVIGLSANTERTAYSIGQYLRDRLGMSIVPVNLRGEDALGERGYRRLAEIPGSVQVVDCFVNSQRVGAVIDQAIAEKDRLGIEAVWLQLGVIDEAAAERASAVGLDVVMNTCPAMEAPPQPRTDVAHLALAGNRRNNPLPGPTLRTGPGCKAKAAGPELRRA